MTKIPTSRLDKLLANMGYASRREIQLLAKNGRILLDGAPVPRADERLALTPDLETRLVVDREALDPLPGFALMVNKPLGVTCSHKEAGRWSTISCPRAGDGAIRRSRRSAGSTRRRQAFS